MTHLLERQTGEAFHEFLWIDCIIIILVEETLDILPNTKVLDKLLSYTSCKEDSVIQPCFCVSNFQRADQAASLHLER